MSTIKSSAENLTLNADGANNDIKFQSNGSEVASIDQAGVIVSAGGSTHADNVKAKFGTGNDLEIYHDGSDSIINEEGTGTLIVKSNGTGINLQKGNSETMAQFVVDGSVNLYHNNVKQLETSTTGIKVGFANNGVITSTHAVMLETTGSEPVVIKTGGSERLKVHASGTTSFNNGVVLGAGVADTAANTMEDYEEGNCTIQYSDGSTSLGASNTARYTKVGRLVTVNGYIGVININALTDNQNIRLAGFPFTNTMETTFPIMTRYLNSPDATHNVVGYFGGNGTHAYIYYMKDNGAYESAKVSSVSNTNDLYFGVTYTAT